MLIFSVSVGLHKKVSAADLGLFSVRGLTMAFKLQQTRDYIELFKYGGVLVAALFYLTCVIYQEADNGTLDQSRIILSTFSFPFLVCLFRSL